MYSGVQRSTIHSSQDLETTWIILTTDEQINKLWCIFMMEYYLATKRNEFVDTWMDLECGIQRKASQEKKHRIID